MYSFVMMMMMIDDDGDGDGDDNNDHCYIMRCNVLSDVFSLVTNGTLCTQVLC